MILTAHVGANADLVEAVSALYLRPGDKIADVTYGRGAFWKKVNLSRVKFAPSDLAGDGRTVKRYDFTGLPYEPHSFDVMVLDPPYMHGGNGTIKESIAKCYGNNRMGKPGEPIRFRYGNGRHSWSHDRIVSLYRRGMMEAHRCLRVGGLLWVKCQDEIESSKQRWTHIEIYEAAIKLGFVAEDLFVLVQSTKPAQRVRYQLHARKNHSYMWVLRKPA